MGRLTIERLESSRNPRVRQFRRLRQSRYRAREGLLLLEGGRLLREALRAGLTVVDVLVAREALAQGRLAPVLAELEAAGVPRVAVVDERLLAAISTMRTPHDVVAAVRRPPGRRGERGGGGVVALDGVQDPGNVGSILRSALAFGFDRAWLSPGTADAYHPKVLRASAGSVFWFLEITVTDLEAALRRARTQGHTIVALDANRGDPPAARVWPPPLVVVVGSEGRGLSQTVAGQVHHHLRIPTDARVQSLNAATAAAVALYELASRRRVEREA